MLAKRTAAPAPSAPGVTTMTIDLFLDSQSLYVVTGDGTRKVCLLF